MTPEEGTRRTLEALQCEEVGSVQVPGLHWWALILYGLTMTAAVSFRWPGSDALPLFGFCDRTMAKAAVAMYGSGGFEAGPYVTTLVPVFPVCLRVHRYTGAL